MLTQVKRFHGLAERFLATSDDSDLTMYGDWLAAQRRIVTHFYGGVKAVGVEMNDFARCLGDRVGRNGYRHNGIG